MIQKRCLLFFIAISNLSFSQEWIQEKNATKVTFVIRNLGLQVEGAFKDVIITTNLNNKAGDKNYLNAVIKVNSIDTGISRRDIHLLEEPYFYQKKYEHIILKSTKILQNKNGSYTLFASLFIKEIAKEVEIPLQVTQTDNKIKISTKFEINRKDFDVGNGGFLLSKKVVVAVMYNGNLKS